MGEGTPTWSIEQKQMTDIADEQHNYTKLTHITFEHNILMIHPQFKEKNEP